MCRKKELLILAGGTFKNNIRMLVQLSVDIDMLKKGLATMESVFVDIS